MQVTVAATQFACTPHPAENVARAESMVRQAAGKGAQVILLQELFETPYFCKDHLASHFAGAHPLPDNPLVRRFQALAVDQSQTGDLVPQRLPLVRRPIPAGGFPPPRRLQSIPHRARRRLPERAKDIRQRRGPACGHLC